MYEKKISASMRERKKLAFGLNIKSLGIDGRFAGYASVFDVVDSQRDVVLPGAFMHSLKNRVNEIKLLWQHQQSEPIGVFDRIFEDKVGLYVEGRLLLDVAKAREAYALLKEGAVSGLSIGYSPVRYKIDTKTGVRMLSEVDLWEVSLVTFPANDKANVTVVKSAAPTHTRPSIEIIALSEALDRAVSKLLR